MLQTYVNCFTSVIVLLNNPVAIAFTHICFYNKFIVIVDKYQQKYY